MPAVLLYVYALPVFLGLIVAEALYYRYALRRSYGWRAVGSNLAVSLGQFASEAAFLLPKVAVFVAAYRLRLFDLSMGRWQTWVLLFFAVDFAYYWEHRLSHQVRWMWAQHSVHHSAQQVTLSVAYRLGWTTIIGGQWLFLVPLCWLGFDPRAVALMYVANLMYQFWLHTETVPKLGPLEWILNTPSHHRVHHAVNPEYLDRNFGGVLIVFDRLFGTFAEERAAEPPRYGLVQQISTLNPAKIAFHEWGALLRDLRAARGPREALGYAFGPPGWSPDGSRMTSAELRRSAG